jgi:hypothetical protein
MKFEPYSVFVDECSKHLEWKRLVVPRGGQLMLDRSGYIFDFEDFNQPKEFCFPDFGCTVLLGEPGNGKSAVLYSEYKAHSDHSLWMDLRHCRSVEDIEGIRNNNKVKNWITSDSSILKICIDNFDLCRLERQDFVDNFVEWLYGVKEHHGRLSVVVASRTFAWSQRFEDALTACFDAYSEPERMQALELAPLRYRDIERWAVDVLGDNSQADTFLAEVQKLHLQPFAMKPLTLKLLLNEYKTAKALPHSLSELYVLGCETLCKTDIEPREPSKYSQKQLLAVASRLAGTHLFCAKDLTMTSVKADSDAINVSDMVGTVEQFKGQKCEMSVDAIRATLDTALFSASDAEKFRFSHQAYAEFLAAQLLQEKNVPIVQLESLLFNARDPERRLVPSLQGVAAWLASTLDDLFRLVLERDPITLFLMNFDSISSDKKPDILDAYIRLVANKHVSLMAPRRYYGNLNHPKIAAQLEKLLTENLDDLARHECLLIAKECKAPDLVPMLYRIIDNDSESLRIRVTALYALVGVAENVDPDRLKKFALEPQSVDADDDLKGLALRVLFPSHISAEDVFKHLTPPKNESLYSSYSSFLSYHLPDQLTKSQMLSVALDWCFSVISDAELSHRFESLIDRIIRKAIDFLNVPDIATKLGQTAVLRMSKKYRLIDTDQKDLFQRLDQVQRRSLLRAMFVAPFPSDESQGIGLYKMTDLILESDFEWLVEQVRDFSDSKWKALGIDLLRQSYSFSNPEFLEVLKRPENETFTQIAFAGYFDEIVFGSAQEIEARTRYQQMLEWSQQEEDKPLMPGPAERVKIYLDMPAGRISNRDRWWHLTRELTLEPKGNRYRNFHILDVRDLPGWKSANAQTRQRLIDVAKLFLQDADPQGFVHSDIATAGYKALALLFNEGALESQEVAWGKWCEVVLSINHDGQNKDPARGLVLAAYFAAPDQFRQSLRKVVFDEADRHRHLFVLNLLDDELRTQLAPWFAQLLDEIGLSTTNA